MKTSLANVTLYCDGSGTVAGQRARHAGWAAILVYGELEKVSQGHFYPGTNQTAELSGLIGGLELLKRPCRVEFWSDSEYLVQGVNAWLPKWISHTWKTYNGHSVSNQAYWKKIAAFQKVHQVHGNWVRGHSPEKGRSLHAEYNVRCDELAVAQAWLSYKLQQREKESNGTD